MGVDYDQVAARYDGRYAHDDYADVHATVRNLITDAERLLEVGCGTGHWLRCFAGPARKVFGPDPSIGMLRQAAAASPGRLTQAPAEAIPFADDSFDFVLAINAIHHFDDYQTFVREAARVLAPGGQLATVALDPATGTDQWYIYDYFPRTLELDRQRYPSCLDIQAAMTQAGFEQLATVVAQHMPAAEPARDYLEGPTFHRHTTSQLSLLTDEEFDSGLRRIWTDIEEAEARGETPMLTADLRLWTTQGRLPSS